MRNIFKIWIMKHFNFTDWLIKQAAKNHCIGIYIDNESSIIYFKDGSDSYHVFSPTKKLQAYFIKENAGILPGAFSKKDIVYRVQPDGSLILVRMENHKSRYIL